MPQARYLEEAAQRRALHNQLVDLKGAIRVFCRVRPLLARERAASLEAATSCDLLHNTITVTSHRYACPPHPNPALPPYPPGGFDGSLPSSHLHL